MRLFPRRKKPSRPPAKPKADGDLQERFPDFDPATLDIIRRCKPFTMTTPERIYSLVESIRYLCRQGIEGDVVECGVWKGGSSMVAALSLIAENDVQRHLHLFDTFEGMPPAGEVDRDFQGDHADVLMNEQNPEPSLVWAIAQLDEVKQNMAQTGYPSNRVHYVCGTVEETLPAQAPEQVALLRLDTDWYESTKHELEHLFPRLAPGGVLIIDDYGHWQGARKAVDEYFQSWPIMLNRVDYSCRICIKPLRQAA